MDEAAPAANPARPRRNFTKADVLFDQRDGVPVVVKTVAGRASPVARLQLRRERRMLTALQGLDCVPRLLAASDDELVLERLPGETIRGRRARGISHNEARTAMATLRRFHEAGFAHGDLGPRDVILTEDGRAVLLDFATCVGPASGAWLVPLLRKRDLRRMQTNVDRAVILWQWCRQGRAMVRAVGGATEDGSWPWSKP